MIKNQNKKFNKLLKYLEGDFSIDWEGDEEESKSDSFEVIYDRIPDTVIEFEVHATCNYLYDSGTGREELYIEDEEVEVLLVCVSYEGEEMELTSKQFNRIADKIEKLF